MRLAIAAALVFALGAIGLRAEGQLRPTSIEVDGTGSAVAEAILHKHFGESAPFVILLKGSARSLDRQGPALVRTLRSLPGATTLSPWDKGALKQLRPSPRKALVLADFHVDAEVAVRRIVPRLDGILGRRIRPPVVALQSSFATLSRAIQDESVASTRTAELLAIPVLMLVLLLIFRSPLAAAVPLVFGAAAVLCSRGVLALASSRLPIDGFSLTVATMMGLALGVDYALLMVSRFREELAAGLPPDLAAARTRQTAGRVTAFAGSTLILAMAVTLWIMPGNLFLSLAGTAMLVTGVSVAIAFFVAPPLLALLGTNVNRWQLGRIDAGRWLMPAVGRALARPRLAVAVIGGALLLLAVPAVGLRTGPPSASQLPPSNAARADAEAIDAAIGTGWDAPFVLVAASRSGPITELSRLAALRRAEHRIAADPAVQAVVGPGRILSKVAPLKRGGDELLAEEGAAGGAKALRLARKLRRAGDGVGELGRGVARAAAGAGLLADGSGRARQGAAAIAGGINVAANGARRAVGALDRLERGSKRLASGQRRAALGSRSVRDELGDLLPLLRRAGLARARRLRSDLRAAATGDPRLSGAAREAGRLVEALTLARNQAERAHALASRLHAGQSSLADGGIRLHGGASRLAARARALPRGLTVLSRGASRLVGGLDSLAGGARVLSRRLADGSRRTQPLQSGLSRAGIQVSAVGSKLSRQISSLREQSPGIFDSGSFVLSSLEGAPAPSRRRAGQVVDLTHGGQAARMLVVPRYTFDSSGSAALYTRLRVDARALAGATGLSTGIAGGPAQLIDYAHAVDSQVPWVVLAITLITFLVLMAVLRAIPLAAIAVSLNLLTVAVAFGVLTLLFHVPNGWPLGGHGYVDAIGAAGIFGIVFGLSIDYAVFLLSRMRESHEAGATNEEAIAFGLQRTARVITGAAAIMLAVFVTFAGAPIATVSQLGTGLTVAVLLDATVVRLVLLPALMLLVGERVWWFPAVLARVLPRVGLHPA